MDKILFFVILPGGGIAIIIACLIFRESLSKKNVIDLSHEKSGLTLKANAFGLLVIVGFALIIGMVTYICKGYGKLRSQDEVVEDFFDDFNNKFKEKFEQVRFDVQFQLIFPTPAPNPYEDTTDIAVWIQREKDGGRHIYEKVSCNKEEQGLLLTVEDVRINDRLSFDVTGEVPYGLDQKGNPIFAAASFTSNDIRIPFFHINMKEKKKP